ncbi:uncharacterized protein LOC107884320 isoform X2 [Acyrthosiphon pisum]|uniref:Uncharacterized protein n=1 Tax=Acyrthosiphon pisum TaxID=7029 RepID=A0A8R2NTU9_ACYPI|nr:uncharacterized protein LOC107884320 isoform X2 [Acyrthosiphon pisum]XP_029347381.1 uncharacterized protein LOC107884320 isoform X2 [Acyrthosiphon pisum]
MSMERNSNIMNINKQESSSVQDGAVQVVQQLLPIKLESEKKKKKRFSKYNDLGDVGGRNHHNRNRYHHHHCYRCHHHKR